MPTLTVRTNLKLSQLPADFAVSLSRLAADVLDKPESRISVVLETERLMWRNGSDAPLVHLDVAAIGAVDTAELNRRHAPRFFEFLAETTLVAVDRIVVMFYPLQKFQVALDGVLVG